MGLLAHLLLGILLLGGPWSDRAAPASDAHQWSDAEQATLRSLWLGSLPPPPADPSNRHADNPRAAALGKQFFFDQRFSGNHKVACATCHPRNLNFADDLPLAHGLGTTSRRSMPLVGVAYNTWFFWDGRKDSLWAQALGPFESPVEHGFGRTRCVRVILAHYRTAYETVFGPLPAIDPERLPPAARPGLDDPTALKAWVRMAPALRRAVNTIYANMGKAIAAYVRTILPTPARFDRYVAALLAGDRQVMRRELSETEARGLHLFIGKARCVNCHNGPLFTNGEFHALGVPQPAGLEPDPGRAAGIAAVLADEFNCLGPYSDAAPRQCTALRFLDTNVAPYQNAFKTPSLRNVAARPPYMHAGQFATLPEVLDFYRTLPPARRPPELGHGDLDADEAAAIVAFLGTLTSPPREGP